MSHRTFYLSNIVTQVSLITPQELISKHFDLPKTYNTWLAVIVRYSHIFWFVGILFDPICKILNPDNYYHIPTSQKFTFYHLNSNSENVIPHQLIDWCYMKKKIGKNLFAARNEPAIQLYDISVHFED